MIVSPLFRSIASVSVLYLSCCMRCGAQPQPHALSSRSALSYLIRLIKAGTFLFGGFLDQLEDVSS